MTSPPQQDVPLAGELSRERWPKVLVVEDDDSHVMALTIGLEREGLAVTAVRDGREVLAATERTRPDVILLDVMLPGISGIEVCRDLRARGVGTPIIIVSARSDELDVVVGIEIGADDYVAKPYRMRELVARIGALLRRHRPAEAQVDAARTESWRDELAGPALAAVAATPAVAFDDEATAARAATRMLQVGDVGLDADRHEVWVRGELVELPLREFQLLRELLVNAGRVVTRELLLRRVWGLDFEGDPRIVATSIGRLRARIEPDPDEPSRIVTIRGIGYRYNDRA